jgi:hypothetical protein
VGSSVSQVPRIRVAGAGGALDEPGAGVDVDVDGVGEAVTITVVTRGDALRFGPLDVHAHAATSTTTDVAAQPSVLRRSTKSP